MIARQNYFYLLLPLMATFPGEPWSADFSSGPLPRAHIAEENF